MCRMLVLGLIGVFFLGGCSSVQPIQQDQPLLLAAGDGIAVVQFDALDSLTQIQFVSAQPGGKTLNIPSVPIGKSTYLFEVPAGRYCLQRFSYGNYLVSNQGEYAGCFVVPAGEVGFSGIYSPRFQGGGVVAGQDLDVTDAKAELKRTYPHIAAQFLQPESVYAPVASSTVHPVPTVTAAPTTPPPAGKDLISAWVEHDDKAFMDTIYVRNNTKWTLEITLFELYDCANIKQACKPAHPGLKLKPHETKSFMQVQPEDPQGAYSYHYRFSYGFD